MNSTTRLRLPRAVVPCLVLVTVAGMVPSAWPPAVAEPSPRPSPEVSASQLPDRAAARAAEEVELPRPARGDAAVRLLADQVDEAAEVNDLAAGELVELLQDDPSAWLATDGRLHYKEPLPGPDATGAAALGAAPDLPPAETFRLHSNPGATRTVFLDFDGATVSGTRWHEQYPTTPTVHPAWDPDGTGAAFSDAEKQKVQAIWAAVSEDFAPFDVDVTTEDPGPAGIRREDSSDTRYGTHVLISPSTARQTICGSVPCGGVAWVDVFGGVQAPGGNGYGFYQPAWVFPQSLNNSPKSIAEAVSHEAGHTLSLQHDGNLTSGYDLGHGAWAPIMGAGYYSPLSQWSKGDYAGANNKQDDVALLAARLGVRPDEAGTGPAGAASLPATGGLIATREDVDTFRLGTCRGPVTVAADVAATAPDLDVSLTLLDGSGSTVATSDPPSAMNSPDTATGLSASLRRELGVGTYYTSVDGVGNGPWLTGYDDYGSLGRYDLRVTGDCDGAFPAGAPSAPTDLSAAAEPVAPSITLTWSAPESPGASGVTGYTISSSAGHVAQVPATARTHTFTGLQPGTTYTFDVAAVNATGTGRSSSVTATTAPTVVRTPGPPQTVTASWDGPRQRAVVRWNPPADDGGAAVSKYRVYLDGALLTSFGADVRSVEITGVGRGSHQVAVRAVNSAGDGPGAQATFAVAPRPVNDAFDARTQLTGLRGQTSGDNTEASSQSGDPVPPTTGGTPGDASVWFAWTAPVSGLATFRTTSTATGRDTTLGVYSGDTLGTLSRVAGNDDAGPSTALSTSTFAVTAGTTYAVAVDGFRNVAGGVGPFTLDWSTEEARATRTVLHAPRTARAGARPVVRVVVTRDGEPAAGRVALRHPRGTQALTLQDGVARYRLPRLQPGRARITASYAGNPLSLPSTASRTIRVQR